MSFASDHGDDFPNWDEDDFKIVKDSLDPDVAEFLQEQTRDLQAFRDERDRDFAEFLEDSWKEFSEFDGIRRDNKPKPVTLPRLKETPLSPEGKEGKPLAAVEELKPIIPSQLPVVRNDPPHNEESGQDKKSSVEPAMKSIPDTPVKSVAPPDESPSGPIPVPVIPSSLKSEDKPKESVAPPPSKVVVPFYGSVFTLEYDDRCRVQEPKILDNQVISTFWKSQSVSDFDLLINQLLAARRALSLNDWAYYRFVDATSTTIQKSPNARTLFSWFILTKSGYRVKLGYSGDTAYLLVPSVSTIYEIPFYNLAGTRYYNITCFFGAKKPGSLHTYENDYPGAVDSFSLALPVIPKVRPERGTRKLSFRYEGQDYSFPVEYNRNTLKFYGEYPLTDFPVFFAASINPDSEKSLLEGLRPLIDGKSEPEAVNFILRFVQTAFEYKTDQDQFGREKYMFAEETIAFPYSDCEDRSILFSFLVKKLLGLETVGLHFPGHMATAVRFTENVGGDHLIIDGKKFTVCDPTYINANIGMTMPQFKGVKAEIVRTES